MQSSRIMLTITALFGLNVAATCAQTVPASPQQQHPGTSQPAVAPADNAQSALPSFDDLDKQHHGYLTRGDIPKDVDGLKPLRAHFAEADTDHNGQLSRDEYAVYVAKQSGKEH